MTPYYQDDAVTIYHGDCREILPTYNPAAVDLLLADPPYGVNYGGDEWVAGTGNRRVAMKGKPPVFGDDKPFDPKHLLRFRRLVLFGANYYHDALPRNGGWIVWDKTGGGRGPNNSFTDVEMAWTNLLKNPVIRHHLWKGLVRDSEAGERVLHPTQKPVALMRWIIERFTAPDEVVLDPYMGSGPVVRAAKDLNRQAIGIEIEERYCEIAAKRMAQEVLELGA